MTKEGGLTFLSSFKDRPDEGKPREKLEKYGPKGLSLWELVAIILRTGERHKGGHFEDVEELSRRLLAEAGFKGLFAQRDILETTDQYQVYKSHAEILVAISEIHRRLKGNFGIFDASEPSKIFDQLKSLQKAKQEQCHVLHIDKHKKCTFSEMVALGGQNTVAVSFSDVLRTPLWLGTSEIIIVHNHLGKTKPSKADISWTLALAEGAWHMHHIKISDHIIIGSDGYCSFQEKGLL